MGEAFFYHMTLSPLEAVLPVLLEKALGAGWRVALRAPEQARLDWLDQRLWLGNEEGFLPHGLAGGPHDADQPILLTTAPDAPNGATCHVSIDGAPAPPEQIAASDRTMILFDGNDPAAVEHARSQWREITAAGCKAKYWSQATGRWEMKAES